MSTTTPLEVYLNDHLAGAGAALQLIDTIRSNNEGTPLATDLGVIGPEVETDRDTLARVMDALDVHQSLPKQAGGKVVERLSRLRLNEHVTGSAEVSRLMELDALSLGVEGKVALWHSLQTVAAVHPALAAFDFEALAARAAAQRAALEPHRLEAAAQALSPS